VLKSPNLKSEACPFQNAGRSPDGEGFKYPRHKGVVGSRDIAPHILDPFTRRRGVASFTPRLLCPQGNNPRYLLDRKLGGPHGPQSWSLSGLLHLVQSSASTPTSSCCDAYFSTGTNLPLPVVFSL